MILTLLIAASPSIPGLASAQDRVRLAPWTYGAEGTMEVSASLGVGRVVDRAQIDFGPAFGWFFADRMELSGIMWFHHVERSPRARSYVTVLAEPSFHHRFNRSVLGFLGVGLGMSHVDAVGASFAIAPRVGLKIVMGRAGVLLPAFQVLYSASHIIETNEGPELAMYAAPSFSMGYAVAW
jgi:hypothetical protein